MQIMTNSSKRKKDSKNVEGQQMTIELVQNFHVYGKLHLKGSKHTFPKAEALKRLQKTNGVWTTPIEKPKK